MPFGYLDTTYIDFPANVDLAYLEGLRTRAGVDFTEVLRQIDQRLATLNSSIDPLVAALITPTTEPLAETTKPVAFMIDERGEYTIARPQLAEQAAIMIPIRGFDVSLGFTEDGLEAMSLTQILNNIDSMLLGFKMLYRKQVLRRLFSSDEIRIDVKSAVTSPGFAGSGTGANIFSGTYPDGTPLPGSYGHYFAADTDVVGELKTVLKAAVARLRKWHKAPFDLVANDAMTALITAMVDDDPKEGFVSAGSALVRTGTGQNEATVNPDMYLGVLFGDVRITHPIEDTAEPNIAIYKTFGNLNSQNPLAWRYDALKGRNVIVRYRSLYPLDQAVAKQDFGIGVNNRTAAVLIRAESGANAYVNPADL